MSYTDHSISEFLDQLASASPAPGGGSAAALAGALGAALVAMVCRLTIGRKNYQHLDPEFEKILTRADALRADLLRWMDEDAAAYSRVMDAYHLPKETEQDKTTRNAAIQNALKLAAEIPLKVATACAKVLEMSETVATQGNKNAASDGGAGALMAEAALRAAILNVEINLGLIQDDAFVNAVRTALEPLKRAASKRQAILDSVQTRL